MDTRLQNELFEKYPKIFRQKDLPMDKTCMFWGIDCEDGWYWLIDQLCDCIQSYCDSNPHLTDQVEAVQIKEKYGSLNFYYQGGDDTISGMVWLAEQMSNQICEMCGSTHGVSQTEGWIKTICKECLVI